MPELYYTPDPAKIGIQSKSSKQAREFDEDDADMTLARQIQVDRISGHNRRGFELYRELLASGWPREMARMHLPLSMYSKMFVTMNLRNLLFFLQARLDKHAQYEIRVYAEQMVEMIRPIVPVCVDAWEKANTKPVKIGAFQAYRKSVSDAIKKLRAA